MTENESPHRGPFGHELDNDPRCEFCDRSLIGRFGGEPASECDACAAEFRLLNEAGKLEIG